MAWHGLDMLVERATVVVYEASEDCAAWLYDLLPTNGRIAVLLCAEA